MKKKKKLKIATVTLLAVATSIFAWNFNKQNTISAHEGNAQQVSSSNTIEMKQNEDSEVLEVKTDTTDKTKEELENAEYASSTSLKEPKVINNTEPTTFGATPVNESDPITISDVGITIKSGTSDFDSDDVAGHDSSKDNDIVRSFDAVTYLVSFTLQNNSVKKSYNNIKYRVKTTLPNAITLQNNVPRSNAEIANGVYKDVTTGSDEKYSEGIMESHISDNGQVFVPVVMNVYSSPNGFKLQPTFELEVVEATNAETGEVETFNHEYDESTLPNLITPVMTVSAKPSVSVKLVQGSIVSTSAIGVNNSTANVYDVGAVTTLSPLPERAADDYRGSTFPEGTISYEIKQKAAYQKNGSAAVSMDEARFEKFSSFGYAPAMADRSTASWTTSKTMDFSKLNPLDSPNAITKKIYFSEPTTDLNKIGVYDSGTFSVTNQTPKSSASQVTNSNYVGVYNPYTYTMNGQRTNDATSKSFSSLEILYTWDPRPTEEYALTQSWTRFDMSLYVDSITYDGITTANDTQIDYPIVIAPNGSYRSNPVVGVEATPGSYTSPDGYSYSNAAKGSDGKMFYNYGNAHVSAGAKIVLTENAYVQGTEVSYLNQSEAITMWDPTGFEYDTSRSPSLQSFGIKDTSTTYMYGVAKDLTKTPPYTMKVGTFATNSKLYTWYATPALAKAQGKISAVYTKANFAYDQFDWYGNMQVNAYVPVTVLVKDGAKTPAGNSLTNISSHRFRSYKNGSYTYPYESIKTNPAAYNGNPTGTGENMVGTYVPTVFDTNGNVVSMGMRYWNQVGESIYVDGFGITTKTEVEKETYQSNEDIKIKVTGFTYGSATQNYDGTLTTTLPKGINYKLGSSTNAKGVAVADPDVTINSDGTTTLKWKASPIESLDLGLEYNFLATPDISVLPFTEDGLAENLKVTTIGDMWTSDDATRKVQTTEAERTSQDTFTETLIQQLTINKKVDKNLIEVGNQGIDDTDTSLTYTIKMTNESAKDINKAKFHEVLPYNGDSRGTKLNGNLEVTDLKVVSGNTKVSYTNNTADESINPNSVTGYSTFTPGSTPVATIKNAKAFLIETDTLKIGESIEIQITVQPKGQKAGDKIINNASMNSDLNLQVNSQATFTTVYGRTVSGKAWYDEDQDGLLDYTKGDTNASNIPVYLYKIVNGVSTLVKENLNGQSLVDASGKSLINTDNDGNYSFENLSEGNYEIHFGITDELTNKTLKVTIANQGTDKAVNSQANDAGIISGITLPSLIDINKEKPSNGIHLDENNNIGLIELGNVDIFKYQEGTVKDTDGDGKLSDEEKAKGTPLQGAEFDLYSEKDNTKIASGITAADGHLVIDNLTKGKYYLVETKAPKGHELYKAKIPFEITKENREIKLFISDEQATILPFTGAEGTIKLIIIALLLIIGTFSVIGFNYYRNNKRNKVAHERAIPKK